MESKWRLNDWLLGLGLFPRVLIARVLTPLFPNLYVVSNGRGIPSYTTYFYFNNAGVTGNEILFTPAGSGLKPNGPDSPFPYRNDCEPDHV